MNTFNAIMAIILGAAMLLVVVLVVWWSAPVLYRAWRERKDREDHE